MYWYLVLKYAAWCRKNFLTDYLLKIDNFGGQESWVGRHEADVGQGQVPGSGRKSGLYKVPEPTENFAKTNKLILFNLVSRTEEDWELLKNIDGKIQAVMFWN